MHRPSRIEPGRSREDDRLHNTGETGRSFNPLAPPPYPGDATQGSTPHDTQPAAQREADNRLHRSNTGQPLNPSDLIRQNAGTPGDAAPGPIPHDTRSADSSDFWTHSFFSAFNPAKRRAYQEYRTKALENKSKLIDKANKIYHGNYHPLSKLTEHFDQIGMNNNLYSQLNGEVFQNADTSDVRLYEIHDILTTTLWATQKLEDTMNVSSTAPDNKTWKDRALEIRKAVALYEDAGRIDSLEYNDRELKGLLSKFCNIAMGNVIMLQGLKKMQRELTVRLEPLPRYENRTNDRVLESSASGASGPPEYTSQEHDEGSASTPSGSSRS